MYIKNKYILKSLDAIPLGSKVFIYGSGVFGKTIKKNIDIKRKDINIIGFLDSFKEDLSLEMPIINIDNVDIYKYDLILVASDFWLNIIDNLQFKEIDNYKVIRSDFFLSFFKRFCVFCQNFLSYNNVILLLAPINYCLAFVLKSIFIKKSVLHIGPMVHTIFDTVKLLRANGWKANYLSIQPSNEIWEKADYILEKKTNPCFQALSDFIFFWKIVACYQVIHSHFYILLSSSGWELPILKKMGRTIVFHGRGCHMRSKELNEKINKEDQYNICKCCDYNMQSCASDAVVRRRVLARMYGDKFIVTTPDLKDFMPAANVLPFFAPEEREKENTDSILMKERIKIIHITNHPGIEGTAQIEGVINELKQEGYSLEFVKLSGVAHNDVLNSLQDADLSIGKMKMGYYANAQVESMQMGVPTITYIRPSYISEELKDSGFIFSDLKHLKETLRYYLDNLDKLEEKKLKTKSSIKRLHSNVEIIKTLEHLYLMK